MTSEDVYTCRYVLTEGSWGFNMFASPANVKDLAGLPGTEPQWLKNILVVARAGDHGMRVALPPHDWIVWFTMNDKHEVTSFDPI